VVPVSVLRYTSALSETQKKRSFERRIFVLHGLLLCACAIVIARLIDLQIIQGASYHQIAQAQQYGGVVLPAKRGEILSRNSKTGETSILATNTTLDLLYIERMAMEKTVHQLPQYAVRLADRLHSFYADCRVIDEMDPKLSSARLALIAATKIVLGEALRLMGVNAPEKM
jgi:cell division protein FtsI/penicillin-binding protein 2